MTRKLLITCDNCAGAMASRVHAVAALLSSRANDAITDCSDSTGCPAPRAWLSSVPCSRAGPVRSSMTANCATAEMGRPPLLGLVQRRDKTDPDAPAAPVYLAVLENVRTATIKPIIAAKVKAGVQFFTDEYNSYPFTEIDSDHRTVNPGAGEYARRDPDGTCVHCNTMEGIWYDLRNFLDHFKGISQRF